MRARSTRTPGLEQVVSAILLPLGVVAALAAGSVVAPLGMQPLLLSTLIATVFFWVLKKSNRGSLPLEIGSFYFSIVYIYCLLPFLTYTLNGYAYHFYNDARLYQANPSPQEMLHIGRHYMLYLSVFACTYLVFRKPTHGLVCKQCVRANISIAYLLIILYLLLEIPLLGLKYSVLGAIVPEEYGQEYIWAMDLPIMVRQVVNHAGAIAFTLQVFILTYLFLNYYKARWLIIALLAIKLAIVMITQGSRTEFVALMVVSAFCYYSYVRRLSAFKTVALSVVLLSVFLALGLYRDFQGNSSPAPTDFLPTTEFESIFANAYDIHARKLSGELDAPDLYQLEGIINLVPQQLLPFEKPNLSKWYVETFYPIYEELGGGLAFGVIAESLLSDSSWLAITWRAVFHGVFLACVFNWFQQGRQSPVRIAAYIWFTVLSYQLFRDSTFMLISKAAFDLLPVVALVWLVPVLVRKQHLQTVQ